MNFFELPPSKRWSVLKYQGERLAEVWFKPQGDPLTLVLRIFRESLHIPGAEKQCTFANLIKAMSVTREMIASWQQDGDVHEGMDGNPEFKDLFAGLPADVDHLDVYVFLKSPLTAAPETPQLTTESQPPLAAAASEAASEAEISDAQWIDYETRWKAILGLEAAIDTQRISMESLVVQMENSFKKQLSIEDKLHALRGDISNWTKAKSRIHTALPKMRDFIHRSVWAAGAPEWRKMETIFKENIEPRIPFASTFDIVSELELLQKARHILQSYGKTVYQESRAIATECENTLRTLQSNALANAKQKKSANSGGKFFKDVRKVTGA